MLKMLNILFGLCFFVICVSSEEVNINTNSTNSFINGRIIGGSAANIIDHKHHVAILRNDDFRCGGSLIKWNWVLTAAHCTYGLKSSELKIRAGSKYWASAGILAGITAIYNNPNYDPQSISHDSALMKIVASLQSYSTKFNIGLIGLATSIPAADTNVILAGWGLTSMNGNIPAQLQAATLKVIDRNLCSSSYYLDSTMFCAGKWTGNLGSCFGDSGGGLQYGANLIGIVSYGSDVCADTYYPAVYCNIPVVRTWILDTILNN